MVKPFLYLKDMRSFSRFGLSIGKLLFFEESVDLYWARQQVFKERLTLAAQRHS